MLLFYRFFCAFLPEITAIKLLEDYLNNTDLVLLSPLSEIPAILKALCSMLGAFVSKIKAIILLGGHLNNTALVFLSPF